MAIKAEDVDIKPTIKQEDIKFEEVAAQLEDVKKEEVKEVLRDDSDVKKFDFEAIQAAKHLVVKKKKKNLELHLDTVRKRLDGLKLYEPNINPLTRDTLVSREFITAIFGGNCQQTFPQISSARLAEHGLNDWMFITLDFNPHAPEFVGAPGLFFVAREALGDIVTQRVFVRMDASKWLYVGQYELIPSDSLTVEEWSIQKDIVHQHMGYTSIVVKIRARIALRKELHREPTKEEVDKALEKGKVSNVTAENIADAFSTGKETIGVYKLKYVGYDVEFKRDLVEKSKTWVAPPKNKNKEKTNSRSSKQENKKGVRKGNKSDRKNHVDMRSSDEDDHVPEILRKRQRRRVTKRAESDSGASVASVGKDDVVVLDSDAFDSDAESTEIRRKRQKRETKNDKKSESEQDFATDVASGSDTGIEVTNLRRSTRTRRFEPIVL